ncbi:MAG: NADH-quinone oxidoreductase subunit L, partial [Chitinophagaceae bacterium]
MYYSNYKAFISLLAIIPLLPLMGFLLLGLFGKKLPDRSAGVIGIVLLLISFLLSSFIAYEYFVNSYKHVGFYPTLVPFKYVWLQFSAGLSIDMGIMVDPISMMMIVIVTFISLMVHIYSFTYLKEEKRFSTYYAFLSLF